MAGDDSSSDKAADKRDPARSGVPAAPLALYRRYRPATFAELKGQDHVTEPLRQALRSGRVNHAYLFSGPRGCGKTSSARILARSLNCEQGPTPDPCGVCESCVSLAPAGPGSIDVIEIDAASHGGIDDARDLRERAFYSPVAARYKIYIIDEAHMVTGAGFNALLKLVEEPPPHLKFVFATTEPEKVIPTIRSRTHHYPFRLVPPAVLRELLEEILGREGVTYEPAVLPVVIRAGAGSVRDSLSVLDQLIAGSDDSGLRYDQAIALLGYTDDTLLDEISDAFAARDGAAIFGAIDHVVEGGHDPRRFAMDLLDRLRDLIVLAAVPDAAVSGLLDVPEDRLERMRKQAAGFGQDRLVRAAETISSGLVEMRGATSPRLMLELMCAQVLLPAGPGGPAGPADQSGTAGQAGMAGLDDLAARLDRLERRVSAGLAAGSGSGAVTRDVVRPARDSESRTRGEAPPDTRQTAASQTSLRQEHAERQPAQSPQSEPRQPQQPPSRQAEPQRVAAAQGSGSAGGVLDAASLRSRWPEVLEAVRDVRKTAWILLSNYATVDSVDGTVLTLAFDSEGNAKGFGSSGSDSYLADVLESMLGVRPVVRAVVQQPGRGAGPDSRRPGSGPVGGADARAGAGRQPGPGPSRAEPGPSRAEASPSRAEAGLGRTAPGPDRPGQRADSADRDAGRAGAPQGAHGTPAGPDPGPGQRSVAQPQQSAANGTAGQVAPSRPSGHQGTNTASANTSAANTPAANTPAANTPANDSRGVSSSPSTSRRTPSPSQHTSDDPRPFTDDTPPDARDGLTGTDLILRELGGRVIEEIGEP